MFSMHPLRGRSDWYYEQVASGREDYYAEARKGGDAAGRWVGTAAKDLRLSGPLCAGQLARMSSGQHPASGEPLLRRRVKPRWTRHGAGSRTVTAEPVGGYDLTFSASKSVSVLYAVGDAAVREAVRESHDAAVRDALGYLEREACVTRRGRGGRYRLRGAGFVAAAYRHVASRARDPQLHTHVVVANMAEADERWTRLDGVSLFRHGKTAGFLYQASLRGRLTDTLGVAWTAIENGHAEIAGVPQGVLEEFSRRRRAIEDELRRRGLSGPRAAQIAALDTREAKDLAVAPRSLHDEWRARAGEHGLTPARLASVMGRATCREPRMSDIARAGRRLMGPYGLTRRASVFDRRDVVQAWAELIGAGAPAAIERVADEWLGSSAVTRLEPVSEAGKPARFSTSELLAIERRLGRLARERRGEGCAVASERAVEMAIGARPTMTAEQVALVRRVCGSGAGVEVVRGLAGTGKTFALAAAREAFAANGFRVTGCALQGRAALELEREAAIPAVTVARLLSDLRTGRSVVDGSVLVVDEAGMVGTRQLAELVAHASRAGAKVILVGDDAQLPELEAGGAFGDLARRHGATGLRRVVRQRDRRDVRDLARLRRGEAAAAFESLRGRGRLTVSEDGDTSRETMVDAWFAGHARSSRDGAAVMLARRHRDVRELNELARARLRAAGRLAGDHDLGPRVFAVGDRVVAGRNDERLGVRNGTLGTIAAVDARARALHVAADDGRRLRLPFAYARARRADGLPQLDHGYALTVHRAQGSTWARSYVLAGQDLFREEAYTALSRHREEVFVYITRSGLRDALDDDVHDIARAASGSRAQRLASSIADRFAPSRSPER